MDDPEVYYKAKESIMFDKFMQMKPSHQKQIEHRKKYEFENTMIVNGKNGREYELYMEPVDPDYLIKKKRQEEIQQKLKEAEVENPPTSMELDIC